MLLLLLMGWVLLLQLAEQVPELLPVSATPDLAIERRFHFPLGLPPLLLLVLGAIVLLLLLLLVLLKRLLLLLVMLLLLLLVLLLLRVLLLLLLVLLLLWVLMLREFSRSTRELLPLLLLFWQLSGLQLKQQQLLGMAEGSYFIDQALDMLLVSWAVGVDVNGVHCYCCSFSGCWGCSTRRVMWRTGPLLLLLF